MSQSPKSAGLAFVLSFIWSGLGQIYNGQTGKGIVMMVAYAISALLCTVIVGIVPLVILWVYGMVDALRTAEKINRSLAAHQP